MPENLTEGSESANLAYDK